MSTKDVSEVEVLAPESGTVNETLAKVVRPILFRVFNLSDEQLVSPQLVDPFLALATLHYNAAIRDQAPPTGVCEARVVCVRHIRDQRLRHSFGSSIAAFRAFERLLDVALAPAHFAHS